MGKNKKPEKNKPLTSKESKDLKGSEWELQEFKKAEAIKKAREVTGTPASKVDFTPGELDEGTRVVDLTKPEVSPGPTPVLKDTYLNEKKPGRKGLRPPKRGEIKRGITSVSTEPKKPRKRKPTPLVVRDPNTGRAAKKPPVEPVTLPEAGPSEMVPRTPGPRVPLEQPRGGVQPQLIVKRPSQASKGNRVERKLRGFGIPAQQVSDTAWKAMGHLDAMGNHQPGSEGHRQNLEAFDSLHATLHGPAREVHGILHTARMVALKPDYPNKQKHLNMAKDALSETISMGRMMEKRKQEARDKGRNNGS